MIPKLETFRLHLFPLQLEDARTAQVLFPHWEIVRYLSTEVPWPYPEDGALVFYRDAALPAMRRGEAWHWTLRLKSAPESMIGCISLLTGKEEGNRSFWLALPWQGQGLMSEACDAVTDFWFHELGFPLMRVSKAIANTPSRRISEKSGMRLVWTGSRDYVAGRLPAEAWEITAAEWNEMRGSSE
jgi:[ribosomal protein S5]-alanine N-acetyltransferase